MKSLVQQYFPNRDYFLVYLNVLGDTMVDIFLFTFAGAFLITQGMPLHFVLLFYGLEFGVRGVFHPLGAILPTRWGVFPALSLAGGAMIIFFILLFQAQHSLLLGFCSFVFYSFSRGVYWPTIGALHSILVPDSQRGKQSSIEALSGSIVSIISIFVSSAALANQKLLPLFFFMAGILILSVIPLAFLRLPKIDPPNFMEVYRHIVAREFRHNLLPAVGYQFVIIGNFIAIPLFLFVLLQDFSTFGIVFAAALFIETAFTLIFGFFIDHKGHGPTRRWGASAHALGNIFLFAATGPLSAFLLQSYNKITYQMLYCVVASAFEKKAAASKNPFLFAAALEMSFCFPEIIVLSIFALIALLWGNVVFVVMMISSVFGLYLLVRYWRDAN